MGREQSASNVEACEELTQAVRNLADEVRVLRDVVDEMRELLSFEQRNAHHSRTPSVLKRMALDPTSDQWGEQLLIVRSPSPTENDEGCVSKPDAAEPPGNAAKSSRPGGPGRLF